MSADYLLAPLEERREARDKVQVGVYTSVDEKNKFYSHFAVGTVQSPLEIGLHHTLQYCLSEWMQEEQQPHAAYLNSTPTLVLAFDSKSRRAEQTNLITNVLGGHDDSFRQCLTRLHNQYVKQAMSNGTNSKRIGEVLRVAARETVQIPKWVMFDRQGWRLLLETNGIAFETPNTHGKYSLRALVEEIKETSLSEDDSAIRLANLIPLRDEKLQPHLSPKEAYTMDSKVTPNVDAYVSRFMSHNEEKEWSEEESEHFDDDMLGRSGQRID